MLLAQKAYVEGGHGAGAVLREAGRIQNSAESDEERDATALLLDILTPVGQELAVAVVPGGQRPGDPGARRIRLHPRVRRRTALPRQPAQPDPRGHARNPEPGPVGPQGDSARRRQPGDARQGDGRDGRRGERRRRRAGRAGRTAGLVVAAPGRRHDGHVRLRRRRGRDGQQRDLPRGVRPHRRRVDMAGAVRRTPTAGRGTSTTASGRRRGTSSATNCRGPRRNSICWKASTAPRWKCATTGSSRAPVMQERHQSMLDRSWTGIAAAPYFME